MAIAHAASGEVIHLVGPTSTAGERPSVALFKGVELEVLRMSVAKHKQIPKHHAAGELTLQCLSGSVEVSLEDTKRELREGDLLYLKAGTEHALRGLEDALLLLTIAV